MDDSRETFSFEIDDLSKSSTNSELFDSEEMGDISELLEDFENKRDDTRDNEDVQIPSEQKKTKDVTSRIPILKERGISDDKVKSKESSLVSTSKIPVRMSNSSTTNKRSCKEQFKGKDKMVSDSKASGLKIKGMGHEDPKGCDLRSVVSLEEEENIPKSDGVTEINLVNLLDVKEKVERESNLESCLNYSEENSTPKENSETCDELLEEKCDQPICIKNKTETELTANVSVLEQGESKTGRLYQESKTFSLLDDDVMSGIESMSENEMELDQNVNVQDQKNILFEKGETKRERNGKEHGISAVGVKGEIIAKKELMNENQNDQNVKKKDLNVQECVGDEKHCDDIVIPSLPVDVEGSDEDSLHNENDKNMSKDNIGNGIFVKDTDQGESIEFNLLPQEADNEELHKEQSNLLKNFVTEIEECPSQEDITSSSLIHDDLGSDDESDDKIHKETKKNDLEKCSFYDLKNQENNTVMSSLVPQGSDVSKAADNVLKDDKTKVCEANFVANLELNPASLADRPEGGVDHESTREEKTKIQDLLNDGSFEVNPDVEISSTCDDSGGNMAKDNNNLRQVPGKEMENDKKSDLAKLTTQDDDENFLVTEDGQSEESEKSDNKLKEKVLNKNYLTKTECHVDDLKGSILIYENRLGRKMNGNAYQSNEHLSDGEEELDISSEDCGKMAEICSADDKGDERTNGEEVEKNEEEEEVETLPYGIMKGQRSNFDDKRPRNVPQIETKLEKPAKDDDGDETCEGSNIEFDDDSDDYEISDDGGKSKKPANSLTASKTAQSMVKDDGIPARHGKKQEDDEANTVDYEMQHEPKVTLTDEPSCRDMKEHNDEQTPQIAECLNICLKTDGTIKSGKKFLTNKTPVPAPRKKKTTTTAALTSRENNVKTTIALNDEKHNFNDVSSENSYGENPQHKHYDRFASLEEEKAVVMTEVKNTNNSLNFEREEGLIVGTKDKCKSDRSDRSCIEGNFTQQTENQNEDGHMVGPTGTFAKTCMKGREEAFLPEETCTPILTPRSEYGETGSKSDHFRDGASPQTLHVNKSHIEYREKGNIERYDSENYLLPQDMTAFSPPFCSTPCERVSISPGTLGTFDENKKVFVKFSNDGQSEQNGQYNLGNKGKEIVSSREDKDGESNCFMAKVSEEDGVFDKCIKDDDWYVDDESIYATSIVTEDFENPLWCERNIGVKSPEYEEVNGGQRGVVSSVCSGDITRDVGKESTSRYNGDRSDGDVVASFRHSDGKVKRRAERNIGDKKDLDLPTWRIQPPSHKRQSLKTGVMRNQSPSVQMSRGVNLNEMLGTLSHDLVLPTPPCTTTDQRTHRWSENTESHYPRKPSQRNSAFVPFELSVGGKVEYPKKHGCSKEKSLDRSAAKYNKDEDCAGYMKYTSDSSCQNSVELSQTENNKFGYEGCLPNVACCASLRTLDDRKTTPRQLISNTEPRIERCFDHVRHSTSNEINLSEFSGSQVGTPHVITFPLSRGPGIAIDKDDNRGTSGIYVKEVIEGGDAYQDGRLRPGDRLLSINGYNLRIASLSQAKSVLRKLKQEQSESFATIHFIRHSGDSYVEDIDSSLDRSVTLPFSPNETLTIHDEENLTEKENVHHGSSYLKEEFMFPKPLMTSTPIDVNVSAKDGRKCEDSSFKNASSSVNFRNHLHDGLLMIAPNTKVHLDQLESSLSFLGLQLSPHQKHLLRCQLEVDPEGYVVYEDFAIAARSIYSLDLSVKEPLVSPEREMRSLPDIVPRRPSINNVLASRRELDVLVSEKDRIKEEIREIKKRLSKKAKMLCSMEDELVEARNDLKQVQNRKMMLLEEERDLEKARAKTSSKMQDYKSAISSLEKEIMTLKASNVVPITSELVSKCTSVNKQIQNLVARVRNVKKTNRNYQNVTQKLMAFAHKVHELQHEGDTSPIEHTYQTVDQIPVTKFRGVDKSRDKRKRNHNKFLSREASRVINTVQGILSQAPLPFGWEEAYTEKGSKFYIDHVSGVTTWRLPAQLNLNSFRTHYSYGQLLGPWLNERASNDCRDIES